MYDNAEDMYLGEREAKAMISSTESGEYELVVSFPVRNRPWHLIRDCDWREISCIPFVVYFSPVLCLLSFFPAESRQCKGSRII